MGGKGSGRPKGSTKKPNTDQSAGQQASQNNEGEQQVKKQPAASNSNQQQPAASNSDLTGKKEEINFTSRAKSHNEQTAKKDNKLGLPAIKNPFNNISKRDKIAIGLIALVSTIGIGLMFLFRGKRSKELNTEPKASSDSMLKRRDP